MRFSIHLKIIFIFTLITALILVGMYIYLNRRLGEHTYNLIREGMNSDIRLVRAYVEREIGTHPYADYDDIADSIGELLSLRTTIIAKDGRVLGDSDVEKQDIPEIDNHYYRPEVQDALKTGFGESRRYSSTVRKNMLYVARVFGDNNIVRISKPLSELESILSSIHRMLVIGLLSAFGIAVGFGFILSALVSKPVKQVASVAHAMSKGDFTKRTAISANDEIGDLGSAINHLSEQMRQKIDEVIRSRSSLEAVLLSMSEGVLAVDSRGRVTLMNRSLKDLLLITDESEGKRPIEIVRNAEVQNLVDDVLKLKEGVHSTEISVLLPEEKTILVHATPILKENETEGAVLVFHNITELRRLEKIRSDFVANVSHELRTPVSTIKGYAETLLDGALEDRENADNFLRIIYSDSERLARLIDDILDLSRIESGKLKMHLKRCKVAPIAERVISQFEKQASEKSMILKTELPADLPEVLVDDVMLAQVFFNLIDNAIKYTQESGMVIVSGKENTDSVEISVTDNGPGIPEEDIPRIFERFYRVDKARSRELGGTGLGLSIVKHIVQSHNGQVWAISEIGKGSKFHFTIPKA